MVYYYITFIYLNRKNIDFTLGPRGKIEGKILYGLDDLQNFIEGSRVSVS